MTTETTDISDAMIGGNASAEGGEEEKAEASSTSGCNIVLANRLVETGYAKKDYQKYIKVPSLGIVLVHTVAVNKKFMFRFCSTIVLQRNRFMNALTRWKPIHISVLHL